MQVLSPGEEMNIIAEAILIFFVLTMFSMCSNDCERDNLQQIVDYAWEGTCKVKKNHQE